MKYCFKKIFIGVSIALILMMFKSCEVKAWEISDTSKFRININSKFDVCTQQDSDYLCINGFDYNYQWSPVQKNIYNLKSNEYIGLREFNFEVQQIDNGTYTLSSYIFVPGLWYFIANQVDFNSLQANQYPISALIKTQDGTECNVSNMGIYGDSSFNNFSPYIQVPTECVGKNFDNLYLIYQPGYNFTGDISTIAHSINYDNIHNVNDFIINRNNTYLALYTKTSSYEYIRQRYYQYGIYMNTSNNFTSSRSSQQNLTIADSEVQQKLNELNKEIYVVSSWIGESIFTNTQTTVMENAFTDIADDIDSKVGNVLAGANPSTTTFSDFINALVYQPIYLLNQSANLDFYDSDGNMTGNLCFSSFQQGGTNRGFVPIPFTSDGGTQKRFQFPCLTRDVYSHIKHVDSSFSYSVVGSPNTFDDSNSLGYSSTTFMSIWLLIQHGVLYYFLVITFIKVIKYCIDTNKAEIEVLEL